MYMRCRATVPNVLVRIFVISGICTLLYAYYNGGCPQYLAGLTGLMVYTTVKAVSSTFLQSCLKAQLCNGCLYIYKYN